MLFTSTRYLADYGFIEHTLADGTVTLYRFRTRCMARDLRLAGRAG